MSLHVTLLVIAGWYSDDSFMFSFILLRGRFLHRHARFLPWRLHIVDHKVFETVGVKWSICGTGE